VETEESRRVRRFYDDAWNRWDDDAVDDLLAEDFRFRGSLGQETQGRSEWRGYRDLVRRAVPDFHNEIVDLVTSPGRAAARLRFSGHHSGVLLGHQGRGDHIAYGGAAFFHCAGGRLTSAWILGDLDALRRQFG
jgi:predicted ester cyclase